MRPLAVVAVAVAAFLAGCQAGAVVGSPVSGASAVTGSSVTPRPTSLATAPPTPGPTPLPPGVTPSPTPVPTPPGAKLYVVNHGTFGAGNAGTASVTVYPATASGDATPIARLTGAAAMEDQIYFPAVDSYGRLFLGNQNGGTTSGTVTRFDGSIDGDVAPTQTFAGFYQPVGIGVDAMNALYVGEAGAIDVYGATATPGTAPLRRIAGSNTTLQGQSVYQIFVERTGKQDVAVQNAVVTFPYGATGNVAPTQDIYGATTGIVYSLGVAADSNGNIYVTNFNIDNVLEFGPTSTGDTAPTATIASPSFDQPWGIFFDANDTAYVANRGNDTILVFENGALASGIPTRTISGADTFLDNPTGVFVR